MYWSLFVLLLSLTIIEIKIKKINLNFFYVVYLLLLVMVTLRYGQGSDYYNYEILYEEAKTLTNATSPLVLFATKDFGFSFLMYGSQYIGFNFVAFSALCSLLIMIFLFHFFSVHCRKSMIPLFVFYSTFYLVYPYSALRQGVALALFLGVMFPLMIKRKYILYMLVMLLAATMHQSVLICFLFPFCYRLRISNKFFLLLVLPFVLILCSGINILTFIPGNIFADRMDSYTENSGFISRLVRLLTIIPLFIVPESVYKNNSDLRGVRNILIVGFMIYSIFSFSDLTAARLSVYFRVFEGLFFMKLFYYSGLNFLNKQLLALFMLYCSFFFIKDINGFIMQADYKHCNVFTYPYFSLFDDDATVHYYRKGINSVE